jgi:hypothetical protein
VRGHEHVGEIQAERRRRNLKAHSTEMMVLSLFPLGTFTGRSFSCGPKAARGGGWPLTYPSTASLGDKSAKGDAGHGRVCTPHRPISTRSLSRAI